MGRQPYVPSPDNGHDRQFYEKDDEKDEERPTDGIRMMQVSYFMGGGGGFCGRVGLVQ